MTQRTTTAWTSRRTTYAVSWDPLMAGQTNARRPPMIQTPGAVARHAGPLEEGSGGYHRAPRRAYRLYS